MFHSLLVKLWDCSGWSANNSCSCQEKETENTAANSSASHGAPSPAQQHAGESSSSQQAKMQVQAPTGRLSPPTPSQPSEGASCRTLQSGRQEEVRCPALPHAWPDVLSQSLCKAMSCPSTPCISQLALPGHGCLSPALSVNDVCAESCIAIFMMYRLGNRC